MDYTTIQNAATKIVDNLKSIDGSINALQNKQDIISTSDMSMVNSHEGKLKFEEIGGKCEQFTTTGKNILANIVIKSTMTNNKVTFTPNTDGSISASGTPTQWFAQAINENVALEKGVSYTFSGCPSGGSYHSYYMYIDIILDNNEHVVHRDEGNGVTFTYPVNASRAFVAMAFNENVTVTNIIFKPMIRLASITDDTYEPYTGGIPAPNPDYPQEIKKVVVSEVKTHGAQLCKSTTKHSDNIWGIALYVDCDLKPNTTYTFSFKGISGNVYYASEDIFTTGEWLILTDDVCSITLTTKNELDEDRYVSGKGWDFLKNGQAQPTPGEFEQVMLVEGSTPLPYEPYTESIIKLSEPIELYGIGDVNDTIEDGKVVRRFTKIIFDGVDEAWVVGEQKGFYGDILPLAGVPKQIPLCDQYFGATVTWTDGKIGISEAGVLWVGDATYTTLEEWKARLQTDPMTVVYELATPVTEPLPAVDQIALNSLSTYDTITYVEIDSEIEPTFQAEYGATEMGGRVLEDLMTGLNSEILAQSDADRITALESTIVNNI